MKVKLSDLMSARRSQATSSHQQLPVTILFADICGSTRLFEKYGDVRAREIETLVLDVLISRVQNYGGELIKTIGDEIMSRFPAPAQAVRAACEMHRTLKNDFELAELNIAVKIGLHHGLVLVENSDVFGDAVNVAARMVSLAKADQIITSGTTIRQLPPELAGMIRSLGASRVRGKQDEMEIFEIIWQDTTTGLTQIAQGREDLKSLLFSRLVLTYRGKTIELAPSGQSFAIGRGDKNQLIVDRELVSRSHAEIEFRQGKFILVDHSTNGTYLLLENGARFFVRREEFTLHEQGIINLGQAVVEHDPDVIRYTCSYA
ncbi:MAG: adenylate/guanylate cyclase domain-containing protein [Candidatus Competibacteraceae bacterium]